MNIEIHGRHALLFDDDTAAAFVNSNDALVEWNSLLIDRYDVRHLLSTPPPSRRRRNPQPSHSSSADADLDHERYLDLPSPSDEEEEDEKPEPVGGFNAVPFSYGNDEDSNDQKAAETEPEALKFYPSFPVPDSLVQNLPPTEKVHQIIARTALFVSKNGGQSEIILRVKQGDNPTFGFLMPDHHLHPYFRFLVDNQDLLHSKDNGQTENEKISNTGALSLLGSVYGTGEDDDGGTEHPSSKESVSGNSVKVDATNLLAAVKTVLPLGKDEPIVKRNSLSNALKVGRTSSIKKDEFLGSLSSVPDKSRASSLPPIPKTELMLVDPPTDMKRLVEKIVEFIIKNGRQFEAVLMEQDRGHGRFPFLIPSNIFHPYYLKVLQKAQESKLTVKSFYNEKEDFRGHISNKKKSTSRENGNDMVEPDDIPLDSERKEKFKMVINKSKKEGSDLPDKSTQSPPRVQVDADQAAAILQAATRGIKPSSLGILYGQPSNKDSSSESQLTHEQKLKAERLKRAKMFVAQLKSGAAPLKAEPSRSSSAEPQVDNRLASEETEKSIPPSDNTSDNKLKVEKEHLNEEKRAMRKYRARSIRDKNGDDDDYDDDDDERDRKRSHRHHTKKHRSHNHSGEDERDENCVDERDYKHDNRRHRSHRSSHKHDDMDKISEEKDQKYSKKKRRSSSSYEDDEQDSEHEHSRKKHRTHHSSHDEVDSDNKYSRKKHRTHHSSHDELDSDDTHSRRKRKHRSHKSSHRHKHSKSHSRHREKLDVSSEEESRDQNKTDKNVKGPNSEREELEEGEITGPSKGVDLVDGASREPSVDVSSSFPDSRPPSQPSGATEVSDDLRAKIRAMLMSTM